MNGADLAVLVVPFLDGSSNRVEAGTNLEGFNQKKPPHRTITIALDMSQAFDTVNHYTLIEKLINTNTPNLITRFIANYIRGRKAFTQYKNKNSFKKQFKAGVPQGGVLSPTLFNIYMSDLPTPPRDIHITTYADDITIYSSDKNYTIAQQRLQPYLEDVQTWTKANDLKLNASKTMTTLFTPDPAEYRDELSLQLDNTRLPTIRNPKILGLTFDPKLTFNEHIKTSKDKAEKTINILKALTSTHWGKNKETLTNTYKTVTRPILEYAGTIYAPIISDKQLTALQVTQNQGLRIATGCTSDTNINHINDETKILPIEKHLRLHSSQLRQKASHPDHPLHRLTTQPQPPRLKKKTIFNNNQYTLNIDPDPTHAIDENTIKRNMKTIHTTIVQDHLSNRPINKLLNRPPPFQIGAGLYAVGRPVQKRNDEDGQIGTIQSLPLERGASFNRFFGEPAHGPPHVAGGASGPIGGCRDESRTDNPDLDLRHVFDRNNRKTDLI